MSVSDSLAQKSSSESEIREENEIRISDISLPPDDGRGESTAIFHDLHSKDDFPVSNKTSNKGSKKVQSSNKSVPTELSGSIESRLSQNVDSNLKMDFQIESISEICLPESSPPSKDSIPKSNVLSNSKNDKCSPVKIHKVIKSSPTDFLQSVSYFKNDNFTQSHSTSITLTADIPLPGQDVNIAPCPPHPPPLPPYKPKTPYESNFFRSVKSTELASDETVTISKCDSSVDNKFNLNLDCNKFELESASSETLDSHLDMSYLIAKNLRNIELPDKSPAGDCTNEKKKIDDSRYSPSRIDSDEESQEFITIKPKVLGKEQAKKRLMAFSLSKQPSTTMVKKQNKLTSVSKLGKEKPPNPNKGAGVQEQFRATISAIEEEKKRMMQNMPNYLFMYRNNLSKVSNTVIPNTTQTPEKGNKDDSVDSDSATKNSFEKEEKDGSRSKHSSPVRVKSSSQRRSTSRRRSSSRSRKNAKEKDEKPDRKDYDGLFKKMELLNDWKTFLESGFALDSDFRRLKIRFEEKQRRKDRRRSRSPENKLEYKPIFNYLKKNSKIMAALQAKPSNPGVNITVPFQEKTVKYTRTKPMITWAENPSNATDFFMPKQMLLENCDKTVSSVFHRIMEQKSEVEPDFRRRKQQVWFPKFDYLTEHSDLSFEDLLYDEQDLGSRVPKLEEREVDEAHEESDKGKTGKVKKKRELVDKTKPGRAESEFHIEPCLYASDEDRPSNLKPRERRVSLVNDDYLSDADIERVPVKEMFVGDVKVQLDVGLNRVKVRSKWDSDYEGEDQGRGGKEEDMDIATPEQDTLASSSELFPSALFVKNAFESSTEIPLQPVFMPTISPAIPVTQKSTLDEPKEKLVSEYEEFMKMVAFEAGGSKNVKSNENTPENASFSMSDKIPTDNVTSKKIESTDWDQESDREEKPNFVKKVPFIAEETPDGFSILSSNFDPKKRKKSNSPARKSKKSSKSKGKGKIAKKMSKNSKKKYREVSSSDSSSESSDSDSDSSDSEDEKRKRKKKKVKKNKKKYYSSSSDTESDSDSVSSSKAKKAKLKKKKKQSRKNKSDEDSSHSDAVTQTAMLKQLDFKKQQIIKKIEEIDSININRSEIKKKMSKKSSRDESSDSEHSKKTSKSPNKAAKSKESEKRKRKPSGKRSDSENEGGDENASDEGNEESGKKKKRKKKLKKVKDSSGSSSEDETKEGRRSKDGKITKSGKKKKVSHSSSSESDSSSDSRILRKKLKKKKKKKAEMEAKVQKIQDWSDRFLSDGPDYKTVSVGDSEAAWLNEELQWRRRRKASDVEKEAKNPDDWEASSREDSPKETRSRESSWDEEVVSNPIAKYNREGSDKKDIIGQIHGEKDRLINDFNLESKQSQIFNEISIRNLGHDISRYSSENSSSLQLFSTFNLDVLSGKDNACNRSFHEEVRKTEVSKPSAQELYSPGHTDSDASQPDFKTEEPIKKESHKHDIYDPLMSDSDMSTEGIKVEINSIPLPCVKEEMVDKPEVDSSINSTERSEFVPIECEQNQQSALTMLPGIRKQMISVKLQQKFQCKVASVFQSDSDEEEVPDAGKKGAKPSIETDSAKVDKVQVEKPDVDEERKKSEERVERDRSKERKRRSVDRLREKSASPKKSSRSSEEPKRVLEDPRLHGSEKKSPIKTDPNWESEKVSDDGDTVRPIPVLTGLDVRIGDAWDRSHMPDDINYSCDRFDIMDPDSYKLYDGKIDGMYGRYDRGFVEDPMEMNVLMENRMRKEKRKSRSRSFSPRKRRRSKTPDRRKSPRHRSISPRRRGRSPFSPRRRGSPRNRRYRGSRSPEKRKSRSPRKKRYSPSRRSRSLSPRKRRSPKRRVDSPRRRSASPGKGSPRKENVYPVREIGIVRNLIPLIGGPTDDIDMDVSPMPAQSPRYDSPMGFTRSLADSTISDSELNNTFYNRDYPPDFGSQNYPEEVAVNNLITLQNHDTDKRTDSPKRLTLDQRIELELGVPIAQNEQYIPPQSYQMFPEVPANQYQNNYPCDSNAPHSNSNGNQNFYNQNSGFNGQFFNGQQQNFGQFQYPRHSHPPVQNSVLQVGNIMEVVPTLQVPPPLPTPLPGKGHQIMQVGNVLQVVPSPKPAPYGVAEAVSPANNQKSSVVLPQSTPPNPEAIINPLIKAIQLEREKRKKEKEKRRAEREARRKARQLRREAKLLSVNEKLKKSVQDEGLMLGQEVDEDELIDEMEHPSPPIPVEIITDSSQNCLPPAGKGILITAGFVPKPASEKKEVKFADGICPGEGTSTSGGEDRASPPPKPKLPKEKRYKKKKTKLKKKVKVHIIRQLIQDDEDEDEDDLSPPPPPPGDPPPVFFARFPFASKAQYPVYQTQTTTTTLTTVQYPTQSFQ